MVLLTSDFGFSTQGEGHNSYYSDYTIWCHKCAAHPEMFKISVARDTKNPTTSSMVKIQLSTSNSVAGTQSSTYMVQCQLSTAVIFKILIFSDHLFWAWRHPHSSHISYLGFIMTMVIVISFMCESKLYPTNVHLN